jgi:hypothetical protein
MLESWLRLYGDELVWVHPPTSRVETGPHIAQQQATLDFSSPSPPRDSRWRDATWCGRVKTMSASSRSR